MTYPYIGELRIIPFNFAPRGWAFANGQLLSISQNQALFSILGTTYGGDGRTTFALPNLQGRTAVHTADGYPLGQVAGEAAHQLTTAELPAHTHAVHAGSANATLVSPSNAAWAANPTQSLYGTAIDSQLAPAAIGATGGSQPHNNMPPYLVLNVIIALTGIYPSRN